ncbi:hypothetical protein N9Q43_00640 [bacterium]|nr:hypothetical protein [bacterium]
MGIIGESILADVDLQIQVRQDLQGKQTRTNTDINLLSNTNAWLKLASSVRVIGPTEEEAQTIKINNTFAGGKYSQFEYSKPTYNPSTGKYEEEESNISAGEQRLRDLGLDNTSEFTGNQLAKKAVLFNTLSELNTTTKTYNSRSGVSLSGDLWNNSSYGLGSTDFGIVPSPGLISAKINCLNRGSIREATVELKAYNLFQFELIELLYLRLGYTMLLEWGWDKFLNNVGNPQSMGNTLTEDLWFQDIPTNNYRKVIDYIAEYRVRYSNNYDGFLGKVVNFDWSFQPDGTYNITLKLITIGDVIESLKVNLPADLTVAASIEDSINKDNTLQLELSKLDSPIVTNAGSSTLSLNLYKDISESGEDKWNQNQSKYFSWFLNLSKDGFKIEEDPDSEEQFPSTGVDSNKYSYFLTFEELLNKLNDLCVPSLNKSKILEFDTGDSNICSVFPNQVSFNPKICLIKPSFTSNINISKPDDLIANGVKNYYASFAKLKNFIISEGDNNISYGKIMNIYLNYDFISNILQKNTKKDGEISIFKFLEDICDGINSSLGGLNKLEPIIEDDNIIKIIDQNPIPGIENSKEFGCLFTSNETPFEIFGYSPSGSSTSNFVRDFGFKTKIGPELASMITIGAASNKENTKNYDGTAFSKWNDGLEDSYAIIYTDPKTETISKKFDPFTEDQRDKMYKKFIASVEDEFYWYGSARPSVRTSALGKADVPGTKDVKNCDVTQQNYNNVTWREYAMEAANEYRKSNLEIKNEKEKNKDNPTEQITNYLGWLLKAFGGKSSSATVKSDLYFYLNNDFYKIGKDLFKGFITGINNQMYALDKNPSNTVGFIPADLSLTVDGLAGIKIYNALSINQRFLPKQYPKALKFIITKVNHNISDNNWDTGLSTISVPKVQPPNKDFFNKVLGSIIQSQINVLTKPFTGPTPNADILRTYLEGVNNYSEKEQEISNGGDITPEAAKIAISVLKVIASNELTKDLTVTVTGGNDLYHKNLRYNSRHKAGNGIDFTISPVSNESIKNVTRILYGFAIANDPNFRFINEYNNQTAQATGKHFHISYGRGDGEKKGLIEARFAYRDDKTIPLYKIA